MKRVWITDEVHPYMLEAFTKMGYEVDYQPDVSLAEVHLSIGRYEGVIINSKILADESLLDKAHRLQFIGRLGSGLDIIDLAAARQRGIAVHSAPEGNRNAVAEHALGMLLALLNKLCKAQRDVMSCEWHREQNRGYELMGKTVGIIGMGNNGSLFAQKLSGMGVQVLAYDKYKMGYTEGHAWMRESNTIEIQSKCDIISLHIPLTSETQQLVNTAFLHDWKPGGILINCARGGLVNTRDLVQALESGHLWGACLDVFENEKPSTYTETEKSIYKKLHQHPRVQLSTHVAGWTYASKLKIAQVLVEKIRSTSSF